MRKNTAFKSVKALALASMLTAMSVVIGIFCKSFLNLGGGLFRVTFENLPIIMTGIFLGPLTGAAVGCASDLVSYLLSPQIYPPNLIVTLGAALVGLCSGLCATVVRKRGYGQIIFAGAAAHLVGSMTVKTFGLFTYYGYAVLWRIPLYVAIATAEITVICLLYKNATFRRLVDKL